MLSMWCLLLLLSMVTSQPGELFDLERDTDVPLDDLEPMVESCEKNGRCQCHITGEWTRYKEYQVLLTAREKLVALEMRVERLDYGQLYQRMINITAQIAHLDSRVNSQSIDVSTKELIDLKKAVEVLHVLVGELQRNATSVEMTAIKSELDKLLAHVDDLWTRNPYGSKDQMREELDTLRNKLQGCKEQFGGLRTSFFHGDDLPIQNHFDTEWCKTHDIDSIGEPFTHRYIGARVGTWFKDSLPRSTTARNKVYMRDTSYNGIISYKNYTDFITNTAPIRLSAAHTHGLGTVAYNGSFYWYYNSNLYRRDEANQVKSKGTASLVTQDYLDAVNVYTYVDLKPDEFGLWGLWATTDNNKKLMLHDLDPVTLTPRRRVPTNKLKSSMCMAFMACGRLYTLDLCKVRLPPASGQHRQYVYDTHTEEESYRSLHVSSKYGHLIQLTYNARDKVLMGWDNGHAVSYPIRWRNIITGELEAPQDAIQLEPEP